MRDELTEGNHLIAFSPIINTQALGGDSKKSSTTVEVPGPFNCRHFWFSGNFITFRLLNSDTIFYRIYC